MYKIIVEYDPADYCYKCSFCHNDCYHESSCMLKGGKIISHPDYDKPEWCPFNNAEEVE